MKNTTNYLLDANIFVEILKHRENQKSCLLFVKKNISKCAITNFSWFSLCIIGSNKKSEDRFYEFLLKLIKKGLKIIPTGPEKTLTILLEQKYSHLDYDDYLQYKIAKENKLTLITLDNDFFKVKLDIPIKKP